MELRSCYFCGSTGRTLETRELVPARPATDRPAPDADRASVVLCPDCDAKLDRVLDRVLDSTRDRSDAAVAPSTTGATAADAGDAGFSTEITFDDDAEAGTADASDPDAGDASGPDAREADDANAADASPDTPRPGSGASAGVDVVGGPAATDEAETADDGSDDADREGDDDPGDEAEVVEGTVDGEEADDDGSSGELRSLGESSAGTYRKALRLLQNREFPMARSDLVDVLSSAYDLDRGECDRLVDFAVERGWLVADGDELRRG